MIPVMSAFFIKPGRLLRWRTPGKCVYTSEFRARGAHVVSDALESRVGKSTASDFDWMDLAEREGFEPPGPFGPTVFKTVAIDHSATSPAESARKILRPRVSCRAFFRVFLSGAGAVRGFLR